MDIFGKNIKEEFEMNKENIRNAQKDLIKKTVDELDDELLEYYSIQMPRKKEEHDRRRALCKIIQNK